MLKKILMRFYHGFSITMMVDLAVHMCVATALGSVVTPGFAARFSCEAAAVLVQLVLVGIIGMAFAGAAMIFEIERWSFLQQGIVHFLVTAAVWMPIAYVCWSPVSGRGMVLTVLGWTLTYVLNWMVQYFLWKWNVEKVNAQIQASCAKEEGNERN